MIGIAAFFETLLVYLFSLKRKGALKPEVAPLEPPAGFVLGTSVTFGDTEGGETIVLEDADRPRHCLLLGGSGTGKTTPNLRMQDYDVTRGRTYVALNYRSDLMLRTLNRLCAAEVPPERVSVYDFGDPDFVHGFDLLGHGCGDPFIRASLVHEALAEECPTELGVQVSADLRMAETACAINRFGLTEIELFLAPEGSAFRAALLSSLPGFLQDTVRAYESTSEDMKRVRSAACSNKLARFVYTPTLRLVFGLPEAPDLGALLDESGSYVVFNFAKGTQPAAGLLSRLVLGEIQRHALGRVGIPEEQRNPFSLYVDECQNVVTERFAEVLCEGRKYKIAAVLSHQHFSQLPTLIRDSERINIYTQLYFATSSIDASTIAGEVTSTLSREEAKQVLTSLPVGGCVVIQRGKASRRIQMPDSKDPKVNPARLAAYKREIMARTGIPRPEAELRLAARREEILTLSGSPTITHERLPRSRRTP